MRRLHPQRAVRHVVLSSGTTSFQGIFESAPSLPMFLHELNAGAASFVEVLACRNSSLRKWRHCTFPHSVQPSPTVPRNTQNTLVSSLKALLLSASRVPTCLSRLCVLCDCGQGSTASRQCEEASYASYGSSMRKWRTTFLHFVRSPTSLIH